MTAIELDGAAAKSAEPFCTKLLVADFESLDLSAALGSTAYDVVIFADVLEHRRDPLLALAKVAGHLGKDGYVLASIPNITHAAVVMEMARGRFAYRRFQCAHDRSDATEFDVDMTAPDNRMLLEFIRRQNPEFNTYQFIIKAVPRKAEQHVAEREDHDLYSKLSALDDALQARDAKLRSAERKLRRIEAIPGYGLLVKVKRLTRIWR